MQPRRSRLLKKVALEGKNEEERKQLTNQVPSRFFLFFFFFFLTCKDARKGCAESIYEMIFYLKNYSTNNREQVCVDDIPQDGCSISLEEMSNHLKTYSKSITKVKNTTLKAKYCLEDVFQQHL